MQVVLTFLLQLQWLGVFGMKNALDMWEKHLDRIYVKKQLFPFINAVLGDTGLILEVGYEDYNQNDTAFANVNYSQWYFVDLKKNVVPVTSGSFIQGSMSSLTKDNRYLNKFRLIMDYGVLGFQPHNWKKEDISSHIDSYDKLLTADGLVLLKWDFCSSVRYGYDSPFWEIIYPQLISKLRLRSVHLLMNIKCKDAYISRLRNITRITNTDGTQATYTEDVRSLDGMQNRCHAYLFTQWKPIS